MGPSTIQNRQMGTLRGWTQSSVFLKSILGRCHVRSEPLPCSAVCTEDLHALLPFPPRPASPVPARRCRQVLSPPMEPPGMSLAALSLARDCPQAEVFLPIRCSRSMFWTFPFFLVCIFCTSVSPAGARSSALFPRPLGYGPDTLPGWSAFLLGPGTVPLAVAWALTPIYSL